MIKLVRADLEDRNKILESSAQQAVDISAMSSMIARQNEALESIQSRLSKSGM